MQLVLMTAFGVGGATVVGALLGFLIKKVPHRFNDVVLGFAAGVMLAAAVLGLILPSLEFGGAHGVWITIPGVFCGALFLNVIDRLVPHLHALAGIGEDHERHPDSVAELNRVLLFVTAIAIHNLPEGVAAGVSFGTGNIGDALTVACGIALQNIPEGMVVIAPLIIAGVSKMRTFLISLAIAMLEVVGVMIGYGIGAISRILLPVMLAMAGGAMLYIVSDEMIPETHAHGHQKLATYSLILGFVTLVFMETGL